MVWTTSIVNEISINSYFCDFCRWLVAWLQILPKEKSTPLKWCCTKKLRQLVVRLKSDNLNIEIWKNRKQNSHLKLVPQRKFNHNLFSSSKQFKQCKKCINVKLCWISVHIGMCASSVYNLPTHSNSVDFFELKFHARRLFEWQTGAKFTKFMRFLIGTWLVRTPHCGVHNLV